MNESEGSNFIAENITLIRKAWKKTQTEMGGLLGGATKAMIRSYEKSHAYPNRLALEILTELTGFSVKDLEAKNKNEVFRPKQLTPLNKKSGKGVRIRMPLKNKAMTKIIITAPPAKTKTLDLTAAQNLVKELEIALRGNHRSQWAYGKLNAIAHNAPHWQIIQEVKVDIRDNFIMVAGMIGEDLTHRIEIF